MDTSKLFDCEVDELASLLQAATRARPENIPRFVEPANNALDQALTPFHHIVFGRRGSGKSSLLQKTESVLALKNMPIAYIDLETFKGHSYPDVLISVLIETLEGFQRWLAAMTANSANRSRSWNHPFASKPSNPYDKNLEKESRDSLVSEINLLKVQLHSSDTSNVQVKSGFLSESAEQSATKAHLGGKLAGINGDLSTSDHSVNNEEITETFSRKKIDFLHRRIMEYKKLFKMISRLSSGDSYLFLDDMYHIKRDSQASVIDYFHRIAKGSNLWLKIGTIRHRSTWYMHGDPSIGLKIGDDASAIDLDITLEKYGLAKDFLNKILNGLVQESGVSTLSDLITEESTNRLLLASGGVARDFLGIFRSSIFIARNRGNNNRGLKIGVEDINNAAGEYDTLKRQEFNKDTLEEKQILERQLEIIRKFIFKRGFNVFLLNIDQSGSEIDLIHELVDLRLLHKVRSGLTIRHKQGEKYDAYLLDISQYSGDRKRRGLTEIPFWKVQPDEPKDPKGHRIDKLRQVKLIYDPRKFNGKKDEYEPEYDGGSDVPDDVTGIKQEKLPGM